MAIYSSHFMIWALSTHHLLLVHENKCMDNIYNVAFSETGFSSMQKAMNVDERLHVQLHFASYPVPRSTIIMVCSW